MSVTTPSSGASRASRRPSAFAIVLFIYALIVVAAFVTARAWLDELAAFLLISLLLWPGLRERSPVAILAWVAAALGIALLAARGHGDLAIDFMPVFVNLALCALFARTLRRGREPLIARVIGALEGPARLALPRVASYARHLTAAWALLLGAQAIVLTAIIACRVPDGLLAAFGVRTPLAIEAAGWRWYLHLGSYVGVLAFLVIEYAFRRWHLRDIPHASLGSFVMRLAQRWPALARSIVEDRPVQSHP